MADAPTTFKFDQWLADRDMSFSRRADDGTVIVTDPTGKERPFNLDALKSDIAKKTGKKDMTVQFNTPDSPVEISPLSLGERFATRGVGNAKGSINYLKGKFDDVKYNPETGKMIVNNKGVWQSVDPSGLGGGSAWDKTTELAKEVSDNVDMIWSAGLQGLGATVGSAVLPGAGTIAGAGAGAGAAAGLRTTFGRALGTYDATPEEQLQDIGMETLFGLAGQAVAPGLKVGMDKLVKTGRTLATKMGHAAQDAAAEGYGMITGVGQPAMRALFKDPGKMVGQMKDLVAKAGPGADYAAIRGEALKQGIADVSAIAEKAHGALPQKYGQLVNEIFDEAGEKGFKADMNAIASDAMKSIEAAGLGRFVPKITKGGQQARAKIAKTLMAEKGYALDDVSKVLPNPEMNLGKGTVEFKPFTSDEAMSHIVNTGGDAISMTPEMARVVKPIVDDIIAMGKQGTLDGRNGAKALVAFQKNLNRLKDASFRSNADPVLERMTMAAVNGFEEGVSKTFEKAGLGAKYAQKAQLYSEFSNASKMARNIVRDATDGEKAEKLLKSVLASADRNITARGNVGKVVELAGGDAQQVFEKLYLRDAASKFSAFRPRWGIAGNVGAAAAVGAGSHQLVKPIVAAGASALGGPGAALAGAAAAAQFSPRLVANQYAFAQKAVPYAGKAMDFVKSLPPKQLNALLKDDRALAAMITQGVKSMQNEDATTEQLLNGALNQ